MTTKTKLKVSVAIISVIVAMAVITIVGLCLTLNKSYTFKGKISFVSTDINATITKANISGGELNSDKMQQIEVDGLVRDSEAINSWKDLDFKLAKDSKDIVITFKIINHSKDKTLKIDLGQLTAKQTNALISVRFDGQDEDVKTAYVKRAKANQQGEITEESYRQVVVTMRVNKKRKDASITDFNLPISLQNVDAYVVSLSSLSVEIDANTMIYTDIDTNLLKLNNSLEVCGNIVTIANKSQYRFKYSYTKNSGAINSVEIQPNDQFSIGFDSDSSVIITSIVKVY